MFRFGIMRDVTEDVVNLETGLVSQVAVSTQFIVCVDLDTGEAYWEGAKKTPVRKGLTPFVGSDIGCSLSRRTINT